MHSLNGTTFDAMKCNSLWMFGEIKTALWRGFLGCFRGDGCWVAPHAAVYSPWCLHHRWSRGGKLWTHRRLQRYPQFNNSRIWGVLLLLFKPQNPSGKMCNFTCITACCLVSTSPLTALVTNNRNLENVPFTWHIMTSQEYESQVKAKNHTKTFDFIHMIQVLWFSVWTNQNIYWGSLHNLWISSGLFLMLRTYR